MLCHFATVLMWSYSEAPAKRMTGPFARKRTHSPDLQRNDALAPLITDQKTLSVDLKVTEHLVVEVHPTGIGHHSCLSSEDDCVQSSEGCPKAPNLCLVLPSYSACDMRFFEIIHHIHGTRRSSIGP
ncbi:hypothetical protein HBI56_000930 [Parastagonospora nodorum]|uniref:Uncharacterized protein n=1 Tax=Phaeosphaeria nodorum (strain SN15 / ATCC MYA-4574 / FGSC 10173) TaxID=321614 RepID=A0A7U2ERM8_PHANO|nr:hypothetical protein HBH56_140150 [Parastagonospora nodorum]QRC91532.1 hypothetical protein JI435_401430 [Parastagonospora nodorum SN15]KAH3928132.1 hypothetical protein HBH54_145290 [Parastagonospora nodorum]KAH3949070.1 hypothetical protein HBH53_095290 [Parastagonospora nodorum]KAH3972319.1 hypothetical protein HBH52_149960 [Parastagonospora nodorum]